MSFSQVDQRVEHRWLRAVEADSAQGMKNGWSKQSAMQVVRLRHIGVVSVVIVLIRWHGQFILSKSK
jgi:hypothetical protein